MMSREVVVRPAPADTANRSSGRPKPRGDCRSICRAGNCP